MRYFGSLDDPDLPNAWDYLLATALGQGNIGEFVSSSRGFFFSPDEARDAIGQTHDSVGVIGLSQPRFGNVLRLAIHVWVYVVIDQALYFLDPQTRSIVTSDSLRDRAERTNMLYPFPIRFYIYPAGMLATAKSR